MNGIEVDEGQVALWIETMLGVGWEPGMLEQAYAQMLELDEVRK